VAPGRRGVSAPAVRAEGLSVAFAGPEGEVRALDRVDLEVRQGEFVCLLGPSGCGKSTFLGAVAGFVRPTSGRVLAGGREVSAPGPDRAMVFQEYALFPWMTVEENVAFGLEMQGLPRDEVRGAVSEWLEKLHLSGFGSRYPKDLSGGMRQRVAIARVLAIAPRILLMDEPFGALDALTRRNLQDELLRLWSGSGRTVLFVTHGIEESVYLADRVVVMTHRPGTVKEVVAVDLARPRDPAAADFNALKRRVSDLVMEEQARHERDELGAG